MNWRAILCTEYQKKHDKPINYNSMIGIPDPAIWAGYLLAILSLLACVVYGILNWNKGNESDFQDEEQDIRWEEMEESINDMI